MTDHILLTPEEAAEILRVSKEDVIDLIEDGSLAGLKIKNKWRITTESITQFLSDNLKKQNLKALNKKLKDHNLWAELLNQSPEFKKKIENEKHEPGSMGAFLQEALAVKKGTESGEVVQFRSPSHETEDS
jgi:excisionase family DNA binding protein